ncbi:MAG: response regulator transcription factor [Pseudomonadota bacterium]
MNTSRPTITSVMVVDDHPVLRAGVVALIDDEPDLNVIAEAGDGASAVGLFRDCDPDVVVMDLQLPDSNGEDLIASLKAERPDAQFLALTTYGGEDTIRRTIEAGAIGYLLKESLRSDIVSAVRLAAQGKRFVRGVVADRLVDSMTRDQLTDRENDVLRELALGQSNKGIAKRLGLAEPTVKIHISHILEKLGAKDRTDAVLKALEKGTIRLR